jgi:hypothetical protein
VATPKGQRAIEQLHVGDLVLSEDPQTGKVGPEQVQAVIVRPVSPLLALDLSDGSSIRVQPNHVFWVDGGPHMAGAGWLEAGQLKMGDRLRTASGRDVIVVRLRWNVGEAVVYTLTVANDHTFFVGAAQVLVHNNNALPCIIFSTERNLPGGPRGLNAYVYGGPAELAAQTNVLEAGEDYAFRAKSLLFELRNWFKVHHEWDREDIQDAILKRISISVSQVRGAGDYAVAINDLNAFGLTDEEVGAQARLHEEIMSAFSKIVQGRYAFLNELGWAKEGYHAERTMLEYLQAMDKQLGIENVRTIKAIGISNRLGPCDRQCVPFLTTGSSTYKPVVVYGYGDKL